MTDDAHSVDYRNHDRPVHGGVTACPRACAGVFADTRGGRSIGSGTLVGNTPDGAEGLVLTCAHVVGEQGASILVEFPGRGRHQARVVAVDVGADLAALSIGNPRASALEISPQTIPAGAVMACGYGAGGEARCVRGDVIGLAEAEGQTSLRIQGAVRPGDSGGCVLDSSGAFVAVVWGQAEGVTYASTGGPLRRFLSRLLGGTQACRGHMPGRQLPGAAPRSRVRLPRCRPGRPILDGLLSTELRETSGGDRAAPSANSSHVKNSPTCWARRRFASAQGINARRGARWMSLTYVWSVIGELRRVAGPLVAMASPAAGAVLLSGGGVGALWLVLRLLARRRRRKSETVGDVPEEATADAANHVSERSIADRARRR